MKSLIIAIVALVILSSCEKVVELDLNSADPKLVVEGLINNEAGPYVVNLTYTTNFFNPDKIPAVMGASVIVSDDAGQVDTFTEIEDGVYMSCHLQGIEGRTYFLNVIVDGTTYSAESYLPFERPIDSVLSEKIKFPGTPAHAPKFYLISTYFTDTVNVVNHYRFRTYLNGVVIDDISLLNDELNDGESMSLQQFTADFKKNDTISIELCSIDEKVYTYYSTLADVMNTNPMSTSAPANPISNISNGALGYFGALSSSKMTIVLK